MNKAIPAALLMLCMIAAAQPGDSLMTRSLNYFDLAPYSGATEQQKLRPGMYLNQIVPDSNAALGDYPRDLKAFKIWHIIPHWTADEGGLFIGDTLAGMDGRPLYDSLSAGDEYIELQLRDRKDGDKISFDIIKNGRITRRAMTLVGLKLAKKPFSDPGLGPVNKGSWLENQINKFGLQDWATDIQKQMSTVGYSDFNKVPYSEDPLPWRLNAISYLHQNPTRVGAYSRLIVNDLWQSIGKSDDFGHLVQAAARHIDVKAGTSSLVKPKNLNELVEFLGSVNKELALAYKKVQNPSETAQKLVKLLDIENNWEEQLDSISDPIKKRTVRLEEESKLAELFRNANRLDFAGLTDAASTLALLLDSNWITGFVKGLDLNPRKMAIENQPEGLLLIKDTEFGRIAVGGSGMNRWNGDYAVIIDLGGNDLYELPPARAGGFRLIIDLDGNDTYLSATSGQASGIGCVDMLFDLKGHDTYRSSHCSQGAAALGVGLLADLAGDDIYSSGWCSQGAATLGIGILYEKSGADNYIADVYSQAFGYIKGIGILMDREGNDSYKAGWKVPDYRDPGRAHLSMSQGFGYGMRPWSLGVHADGGIGVLTDYNGNDIYNSDFFSQGGSYWYALGILHDGAGCDRYTAGQYSQGSGIHLSFGALLDDGGKDMYDAYAGLEQGNAHDLSAGCLEDSEGDDTYRGFGSSQGSALTVAFAWLLDSGGNDMYICNPADTALSQGGGRYNTPRMAGSLGILLDLGMGKDTYTEPRMIPGEAVIKGRKGIIFDDGEKK